MSLIRLHNVAKQYGDNLVLREVYFRLSEGERVGLIGKNGTGKTTALKLILGEEQPTQGAVEVDEGVRIGYFSQFSELSSEATILEVLDGLFADVHAIEEELLEIEIALEEESPQGGKLERLVNRQAELLEEMERREGWTYQNRIDTVLTKLGFSEEYRTRPIDQLSGGWRNRA
ncbi:MAG: ABC-F family ATP-binding cassette domain-containing protein, partial [Anaerolineae bacterium]|nr:ABC-F family ATP-binding cassette domain-containing protein [Anaerolineae bacterium]